MEQVILLKEPFKQNIFHSDKKPGFVKYPNTILYSHDSIKDIVECTEFSWM